LTIWKIGSYVLEAFVIDVESSKEIVD